MVGEGDQVKRVNGILLDLTGEAIKLAVLLKEMPVQDFLAIQFRLISFFNTISEVPLPLDENAHKLPEGQA